MRTRDWQGYGQDEPGNTYAHLMECDLPTGWLQRIALQCYTHDYGRPMWQDIAATELDARDYYYGTLASDEYTDEVRRSEAALVLGAYGWTRAAICRVFS